MTEATADHAGGRVRAGWRRHRSEMLLAMAALLLAAPVLQPLMAQQASRYAFTAALVDHGTVRLDAYEHLLGIDVAERGGHLYSDKAPGQPVWAVPAYGAYRLLGGSPAAASTSHWGDLGLWATSLWSAALPAAALAVAMRRLALRTLPDRPATAGAAALSLSVATLLLPFSTQLFSHVLAGLLGVGAWLVATGGRVAAARLLAAGALAGAAVTVEYPMILVAVSVVAGAMWHAARQRPAAASPTGAAARAAALTAAGGLPFGLALAAYHRATFGGVLAFPYHFGQFPEHQGGLVGARLPDPATTAAVLVGERGLFTLTPLVAAAVAGLVVVLVRGRATSRVDAVAAVAVLAAFVALMGGWTNPYGGASPGPRYVVAALPWLAGGAAVAWARARWVTAVAAGAGAAAMLLATFTLPLAQPTEPMAVLWWLERAAAGEWADTVLTEATGWRWPLALPPALAVAAGWGWWRSERAAAAELQNPRQ